MPMTRMLWIVPVVLGAVAAAQERSPFTNVRFEGERVFVVVEDAWFELESIDGVDTPDLVACARHVDSARWRKRVAEDLVHVLQTCGRDPGDSVILTLLADGGERLTMPAARMTEQNRRLVRERWTLHVDIDAAFADLANVIMHEHAYAALKGLDIEAMTREAAARCTTRDEALLEAQKLICRLGDGHARINDWASAAPEGRLPFVLWPVDGGVMGFVKTDGHHRLLADGFPFVTAMDGVAIEDWINAASAYVPDGSAAMKRRWPLLMLANVNLMRAELGMQPTHWIEVELASPDGRTTTLTMRVEDQRMRPPRWPSVEDADLEAGYVTRRLPGGYGYVRLVRMIEDAGAVREAVVSMRDAPGIILDVRSNGGGHRDAIRQLLPLFLKEKARVVNVAARRIHDGDEEPAVGWLAGRSMHPVDWDGWTTAQREAVDEVMMTFVPEWSPPEGQFSAWQAMVISRGDVRFDGPVVVLMDSWCFSATDIFLGAFKGVEGVTLVGEASGGGSAYSRGFEVEGLGRVRLARMASYLPDGRLYDGNGIQPDVPMTPTVDDVLGKTDSMLDAAIRILQER